MSQIVVTKCSSSLPRDELKSIKIRTNIFKESGILSILYHTMLSYICCQVSPTIHLASQYLVLTCSKSNNVFSYYSLSFYAHKKFAPALNNFRNNILHTKKHPYPILKSMSFRQILFYL